VVLVGIGDPGGVGAIDEIPEPEPVPGQMEQAVRGYGNVADALLHLGHYRRAERLNRHALQLAIEHVPSMVMNFELTNVQLDWLSGRWDDLERRAGEAIRTVQDWPSGLGTVEAVAGLLLMAQGSAQAALAVLEPLAGTFDGDLRVLTWVAAGIARIRLASHDAAGAVEACVTSLAATRANGTWATAGDLAPVAVQALLAAQRRPDAEQLAAELDDAITGRDAPAAMAASATCRGLLGASAEDFLRGEQAWLVLPRPYEAARARAMAGRCRLDEGSAEGPPLLLGALASLERLGAAWDAEEVRNVLRRHGLLPAHRRGRRSYGTALSPREEQVARLASQGLHNREIAGTLFLSVKTVEGHLSSAVKKLGVASRSDLAEALTND